MTGFLSDSLWTYTMTHTQTESKQKSDPNHIIQSWLATGDPTRELIFDRLSCRALPPIPESVAMMLIRDMHLDTLPPMPSSLRYLMLSGVWIQSLPPLPESLRGLCLMDCTIQLLPRMPFLLRWNQPGLLVIRNCKHLLISHDDDEIYLRDSFRYAESWDHWWAEQKQVKKRTADRCAVIKEELMAATWHPERFLTWCVDEEERHEWMQNQNPE